MIGVFINIYMVKIRQMSMIRVMIG